MYLLHFLLYYIYYIRNIDNKLDKYFNVTFKVPNALFYIVTYFLHILLCMHFKQFYSLKHSNNVVYYNLS